MVARSPFSSLSTRPTSTRRQLVAPISIEAILVDVLMWSVVLATGIQRGAAKWKIEGDAQTTGMVIRRLGSQEGRWEMLGVPLVLFLGRQ